MAAYQRDTGCASYIGIASIVIAAIYLLFTNPNVLFEGAFNILSTILLFFLIIGLGSFLSGISFKKENKTTGNKSTNIEPKNEKHLKKEEFIPKEKKEITTGLISSKPKKSTYEWWDNLDKNWKSILIENFLEENSLVNFNNNINAKLTENELDQITCLTKLTISEIAIPNLEPLKELVNLKELYLSNLNVKDCSPINNLKELERLEIINLNITETEFLKDLMNIKHLNFSKNLITSRHFGPVEKLTSLNYLNISHNKLHAFGGYYREIRLNELEYVDLSSNKIQSLSDLSMLKNLKILILRDNFLDKIEHLYKSKDLNLIDLENNILTEQQIHELKSHLPNCEIKS